VPFLDRLRDARDVFRAGALAAPDALAHVGRFQLKALERRMPSADYRRLAKEGVEANAAVLACLEVHAISATQGAWRVTDADGNPVTNARPGTPAARQQ
jgi:hypothetical protein